jgi:hypothetical protein
MHQNVALRASRKEPTVHYFGKWPFRRVWGIQELFSSLFSLINAVPHVYYLIKLCRLARDYPVSLSAPNTFVAHWISFAAVAINTWVWSTVFHARDTFLTERLDYFCAFSIIIWGLWIAVSRTLHLQIDQQIVLLVILLFGYFSHLLWMSFVLFDYGWNTLVNAVCAFVCSFFWLRWAWSNRDRTYVYLLVVSIVGVYPMSLLELLDFPPFFELLDAHALWHLSTIPFTFIMYEGILRDLQHEAACHRKSVV